MEKTLAPVVKTVSTPGPRFGMETIDRRMTTVEMIAAETMGMMTRVRLKQFRHTPSAAIYTEAGIVIQG